MHISKHCRQRILYSTSHGFFGKRQLNDAYSERFTGVPNMYPYFLSSQGYIFDPYKLISFPILIKLVFKMHCSKHS